MRFKTSDLNETSMSVIWAANAPNQLLSCLTLTCHWQVANNVEIQHCPTDWNSVHNQSLVTKQRFWQNRFVTKLPEGSELLSQKFWTSVFGKVIYLNYVSYLFAQKVRSDYFWFQLSTGFYIFTLDLRLRREYLEVRDSNSNKDLNDSNGFKKLKLH